MMELLVEWKIKLKIERARRKIIFPNRTNNVQMYTSTDFGLRWNLPSCKKIINKATEEYNETWLAWHSYNPASRACCKREWEENEFIDTNFNAAFLLTHYLYIFYLQRPDSRAFDEEWLKALVGNKCHSVGVEKRKKMFSTSVSNSVERILGKGIQIMFGGLRKGQRIDVLRKSH